MGAQTFDREPGIEELLGPERGKPEMPPCWEETHDPFGARSEPLDDDRTAVYGLVRSTSWNWAGERTDLHDVFSCFFAALLRVYGPASARLIDRFNPAVIIKGELYARWLLLAQPIGATLSKENARLIERWLRRRAAMTGHDATMVFDMNPFEEESSPVYQEADWSARVRKALRTNAVLATQRYMPVWKYASYYERGVSVTELPPMVGERFRDLLNAFRPLSEDGPSRKAIRSGSVTNAISHQQLKRARRLIKLVEPDAVRVDTIFVPIESHLLALGSRTFVAIRTECGREAYADETLKVQKQRDRQAAVFFSDARFVWTKQIDDARCQQLILELIQAQRDVHWVREVGASRDRDGGRDFVAFWDVMLERTRSRAALDEPLASRRKVLVQVKVRARSVGKADVTDIRDTLEHFECDGFLLVAFPRITAPLFDHLDKLRERGDLWIDWWEQTQIEEQMRRHPDIAARFSDLVQLVR
jgi:hypothetical protein